MKYLLFFSDVISNYRLETISGLSQRSPETAEPLFLTSSRPRPQAE